ncbi:MAG: DUF4403 family protein [Cyclobacteriaceae bacterium]|nr:DUF4403 family protein [Cyclobacteriaceae bacterium]
MKILAIACCYLILLQACTRISPPAPERIQLDSVLQVPVSELNVPVYYPVAELEAFANEKLGGKIIEANIALSKKGDSLSLAISRFQPVKLSYDGERSLTYKIPVQIDGLFQQKVLGIKIKNKTPVHTRIIITMESALYLDQHWDLAPKTEIKGVEWIEDPKLNIAGIKFNLRPPIEKLLESNKEKIIAKLDGSIGQQIKIGKSIEKLWVDIQKPIRINRKVVPFWLKFDATDMNGRLVSRSKDTLMVEAGLMTTLSTVLDSAAAAKPPLPFPKFKSKESVNPGLDAYAKATIPFALVNQVVKQITDTMKFNFSSHQVRVANSEVYGTPGGIAIRLSVRGSLRADLFMKGTVGFDTLSKKLVIDNFGFDVNSEQSLINAADWFVHDEFIERIRPYLSLPVDNTFKAIPNLITRGIEKGRLGRKIDIHFSEFDVNIYQYLITTDNIQVILSARGKADVRLEKGLFNKKKPA